MTILKKAYTRYRTAFYAYFWYEEEKKSFKTNLNYNLKNFLLIFKGEKFDVYYEQSTLPTIEKLVIKKFKNNFARFNALKAEVEKKSAILSPYLKGKKKIKNLKELKFFYQQVIRFWIAMEPIFFIPDFPGINKKIKNEALKIRRKNENYSQTIDGVFRKHLKLFLKTKDFVFATPKDVFKNKINKKDLAKRRKGFFIFGGKIHLISELDNFLKKNNLTLYQEKLKDGKEIKGIKIFGQGKIKGEVKIVSSKKDFKRFSKNKILVTEMTSPNFLPIMKKSKAIITDEGGLTCHAAIIAREMKKLCLVGTKIATQILKDGDMVEVDANKGIIRKLK